MMGNYLTCSACHGPDAHDGLHVMQMQTMDVLAIYYSALTNMMVDKSGEHRSRRVTPCKPFRKQS